MGEYNETQTETLQRVRRIETRLHVMCAQLNISGSYAEVNKCEVNIGKDGSVEVHMESVDVALSTIKKAIVSAGMDPLTCGEVMLYNHDTFFGSVYFE